MSDAVSPMKVSCAFPPSASVPGDIVLAEQLGYARAWCYDSPALYGDVWMTLALAAERTSSIGLGPAVLIPSLRHPMVNASALMTLEELAPGRVAAALGTGFTGRNTMGQPPMRWDDVTEYFRVLRALLRGEETVWEGQIVKIMERAPVDIPLLVAGDGPKGRAVAVELGDGIFCSGGPAVGDGLPDWRGLLISGTVVQPGEQLSDERIMDAAGPSLAVVFHGIYQNRGAEAVDALPGGRAWREFVEDVAVERRHLAVHEGHLARVTERDRAAVQEAIELLPRMSYTGSAEQLRERVAELRAKGVTEIAYQPTGSDVAGELERFMAAVGEG